MRHRWFSRPSGAILPATAFLLPPLAVFAPLGAAPLLVIASVLLLLLDGRRALDGASALAPLALLLAALGLWGTASSLWSIIPTHSFFEGIRFLGEAAAGLVLMGAVRTAPPWTRRRVGALLLLGVLLALLLLALARFDNAPILRLWHGLPSDKSPPLFVFDRGTIVLVLMLWPTVFALDLLWQRVLLIAAVLALAATMESTTAILAGAVSVVVFLMARYTPRFVAAAMIAGTLALAIAIPVATPGYQQVVALHEAAPWIKWSGIQRLLIWRFGAEHVAERPILGWGMDSSRAMPGGKTDLNVLIPDLHYPGSPQAMPLHPHDAALQLQLELGVPGLVLGLAIFAFVVWRLGWETPFSPERRAGALALTTIALTVGLLSFGVWQSWWQSTAWLVAALYAATGDEFSTTFRA